MILKLTVALILAANFAAVGYALDTEHDNDRARIAEIKYQQSEQAQNARHANAFLKANRKELSK